MKEFFKSQGFIIAGTTPEQFRAFIEAEVRKWAGVIKAAHVTVT